MKTLYFLRHAHAESRNSAYADFDRPLEEKGRAEAQAVLVYMQEKKLDFDFVMCSAALRAQETLEPLRSVLGTQQIDVSEKFYNLQEDQILGHLHHIPQDLNRVLYIGHNPGLAFAVLRLAQSFSNSLSQGVEPATLVGFELPIDDWKNIEWGMGALIDFFRPTLVPAKPPLSEGS